MSRAALVLVASAAALAAPSTGAAASPSPAAIAAARDYAATRPGTVAFAVRTPTTFEGVREDRVFASASVLKAMLLVAYTRSAPDRRLRAEEKRLLDPMIRRSDNAATNVLFSRVGTRGLRRLAKTAGMTRFRPASPVWGNSQVTARDQTRFFLRIDTLLPPRHRAYGLRLLRTVVPSQRWGIGRVELPDWRVYFKGGWGSGTGAIDHQVALLTRGEERMAIAVLTAGNGSHAAGKETLEGIFERLLDDVS
jgi:beta-lactamase class A